MLDSVNPSRRSYSSHVRTCQSVGCVESETNSATNSPQEKQSTLATASCRRHQSRQQLERSYLDGVQPQQRRDRSRSGLISEVNYRSVAQLHCQRHLLRGALPVEALEEAPPSQQQRKKPQDSSAAMTQLTAEKCLLPAGGQREGVDSADRQHLTFDLHGSHFSAPAECTSFSQVLIIRTPFSFHSV